MANITSPHAVRADLVPQPTTPRAFNCRCGRPIFFRNSECLGCGAALGYEATRQRLLPLETAGNAVASAPSNTAAGSSVAELPPASSRVPLWREAGAAESAPRYRRCSNLDTAAGCNWLVAEFDPHAGPLALCRCCRLTRTLPDLSVSQNALWWNRIELAKRRLVSTLIGLQLPVQSKMGEDPARGFVFDLLRAAPGGPPVVTGHDDGVITIDVEEADDATREHRRGHLGEPYRTLLGHLRHETGHYYWQRLVEEGGLLEPWRSLFGDERLDYLAALQQHYVSGPPGNWGEYFVSAYASCHPWEDWAETWAHYLHMVDTLDTARSFGLDGERVELHYERFSAETVADPSQHPDAAAAGDNFFFILNSWMELTGVLNELSHSMGVHDFYPFVLSAPAVLKLRFVHRVVSAAAKP